MADIDLQASDASHEFGDGAIFERVDPEGSGTGNYDPFLTVQHKDQEAGYNTDETGQLDNVYSSGGTDGRTNALLLSNVPIKIVNGVAYYEFRVDLNENNSDPIISVEQLEIYASSIQATSTDYQGLAAADAFLAADGFTKVFDLGGDRLVLSDATSSGSGTDDYRFLVPVENFGDVDPSETYVTLYTEMGLTDTTFDSTATFEEWRTEVVVNATINGVKFVDVDRDGVLDQGEEGLGGITVFIDADRDGVFDDGEASTVTAADGSFHFDNVTSDWADGSVWVDEVVPAGYDQTTGAHEVAYVAQGGDVSVEIGNARQTGDIHGTKMADTDNDGDGDEAVEGWTIHLYEDEDGDGVIDAGVDDLIATTVTDADGNFHFNNLLPDTYIVKEESRTGWQAVTPTTVAALVCVDCGTDVNFVNEQLGSISGTKLADTNNDDVGDVGVAGWTIRLYEDEDGDGVIDSFDNLLATTVTDANGNYSFENLGPGNYIVKEAGRTGWQSVTPMKQAVAVTAGGEADVDFVNEQLGSISGSKLADTDNDDDGDEGVQGWTIKLYKDVDGDGVIDAGVDTLVATTVTNANGDYSFANLAPGDYIVEEETRDGWQSVTATVVGAEVTAGAATDIDFVNEELGSISGTKTADTDNDGDGDEGVAGWTVELYEDNDGDGVIDADDDLIASTTTDANGDYSFDDLAPGDYIVKEESRSGWQSVTATVVGAAVTAGDDTDVDFVNEELGSISGTKLEDIDNDDDGDVGVEGWTIELYEDEDGDGVIDAEDALIASTTTDANGDYTFGDLGPGSYIVKEESRDGWQNVTATVVGADVTAGDDTDVDFINERFGSISGSKLADTDNDNDGDVGVADWTVWLYEDEDGDGVIDAEDDLLATTTTDANGAYSFEGLVAGDYIVKEESKAGWQAVTATSQGVTVAPGDNLDVDFVNEQLGSISGTKTADTDNDNDGDVGVAGWKIRLYEDDDGDGVIDASDALLATTTTDANGNYSFANLAPGTYIVKEAGMAGWQAVTPVKQSATVTAGQDTDVDFVNEQLGSISGSKLADTDNDDDGDVGVAGWTIKLYKDVDGDGVIDAGVDTLVATTVTDASGNYSFANLAPGDYIVKEATQAGWQAISAVVQGTSVVAGQTSDVDFVNEELGSIAGSKLADTDDDDDGDEGVAGWTIQLYEDEDGDGVIDAEDDLIDTTVTDANGDYSFDDVAPGDYIVREETRDGWQSISATTQGVSVNAGDDLVDVDFVNEELGSISGSKLADIDNDDDGDEGVAGWTIELYEDEDGDGVIDAEDDLIDTTTTDANGAYSFDDLDPGDYIVREETRSGWQNVTATTVGAAVGAGSDIVVDFVNEELGSISGSKFADLDQDGTWDQDEGGLQGWTISLFMDDGDGFLDPGDTLVATTQTDANGDYSFDDLAPGDYIVVESVQNGWVQTAPNGADSDPESGDVNGGGMGFSEFGHLIDLSAGEDNVDNDFGNFLIPGPGVRTPGFWQSPNGLKFWDGIVGNETKFGPEFPEGELAPDGYLILGDDGDGVVETGELRISVADAQVIIDASNKGTSGAGYMLARDLIAATLNQLAGNPVGDPSDTDSPAYFMEEGVDWLIKYVNGGQSGAGDALTLTDIRTNVVKPTSKPWTVGTSDDGIESGAAIHNALDQYNNTGSINGVAFAEDGDNGFNTFEQQYQVLLTEAGYIL